MMEKLHREYLRQAQRTRKKDLAETVKTSIVSSPALKVLFCSDPKASSWNDKSCVMWVTAQLSHTPRGLLPKGFSTEINPISASRFGLHCQSFSLWIAWISAGLSHHLTQSMPLLLLTHTPAPQHPTGMGKAYIRFGMAWLDLGGSEPV